MDMQKMLLEMLDNYGDSDEKWRDGSELDLALLGDMARDIVEVIEKLRPALEAPNFGYLLDFYEVEA